MHVHSSSCYSRSYSREAFFGTLLNSDLDVIAVTDHNIVDVELMSELQSKLEEKGKTLIGGVELNIRLHPDTIKRYSLTLGRGKKGEFFHVIVWFSLKDADAMANVVNRLFQNCLDDAKNGEGVEDADTLHRSLKEHSRITASAAIYLEDFQKEVAAIPHLFIPHENKERSLSDYLPNKTKENQSYKDRLFYYSSAMAVEGGSKSRRYISSGLAAEING